MVRTRRTADSARSRLKAALTAAFIGTNSRTIDDVLNQISGASTEKLVFEYEVATVSRPRQRREQCSKCTPNDDASRGSPSRGSDAGSTDRPMRKPPAKAKSKAKKNRVSKSRPGSGPNMKTSTIELKHLTSKGLYNRGPWCYRNALLQALLHTRFYRRFLLNIHQRCVKGPRTCVTCAQIAMYRAYFGQSDPPSDGFKLEGFILDKALKACFGDHWNIGDDITNDLQSDPFDLFTTAFIEDYSNTSNADRDFVERTFRYNTTASWQCKLCGRDYDNVLAELQTCMDVPINQPERGLPLTDYIDSGWGHTTNPYQCENTDCAANDGDANQRPDQTDTRTIETAADILILRLKQFTTKDGKDGKTLLDENGEQKKFRLGDKVPFEEHLDLSDYYSGKRLIYRLESVIHHSGDMKAGHYITTVRRGDQPGHCLISDKEVTEWDADEGDFMTFMQDPSQAVHDHQGFVPYVLVYSKFKDVKR